MFARPSRFAMPVCIPRCLVRLIRIFGRQSTLSFEVPTLRPAVYGHPYSETAATGDRLTVLAQAMSESRSGPPKPVFSPVAAQGQTPPPKAGSVFVLPLRALPMGELRRDAVERRT